MHFLNSLLEETVYMTKPPRFEVGDTSLIRMLNKALNGLKQALRQRFDIFKFTLLQFGLSGSKCDYSLPIDINLMFIFWYMLVLEKDKYE